MTHHELRNRWASRLDEYRDLGIQLDGAKVVRAFLSDLDTLENEQAEELLSLRRAAQMSGYDVDSLGRLIRTKKIPNAGRKGKPLIRRGDLPRKPTKSLASKATGGYDPDTDARTLLSRLGGR